MTHDVETFHSVIQLHFLLNQKLPFSQSRVDQHVLIQVNSYRTRFFRLFQSQECHMANDPSIQIILNPSFENKPSYQIPPAPTPLSHTHTSQTQNSSHSTVKSSLTECKSTRLYSEYKRPTGEHDWYFVPLSVTRDVRLISVELVLLHIVMFRQSST